jgi:hypothetical protein
MLLSEALGRLYVNVAVGRPTWQSDTYSTSYSSNAVDGNTATCASTWQSTTFQPWWVVDLGAPSYVGGVIVKNVAQSNNGMSNCRHIKRTVVEVVLVPHFSIGL